ncbi:MAG TPA: hypothetical protein VJ183_17930 [Chloroflexia bacterium]|nr:hypothetical protein [Chloroflexia bacterium]
MLHWDRVLNTWLAPATPNIGAGSNYLNAITVITSDTDAWAVGYYYDANGKQRTLTMRWNGQLWSVVSSPNSGGDNNILHAVAPISSSYLWSVGEFYKPPYATLTERWNGTTWSIVGSPNYATSHHTLWGVAVVPGTSVCAGGDVWAVGTYTSGNVPETLILRYTLSASCSVEP